MQFKEAKGDSRINRTVESQSDVKDHHWFQNECNEHLITPALEVSAFPRDPTDTYSLQSPSSAPSQIKSFAKFYIIWNP